MLRQAGVPLLFDDELGHYRIPGTYFLPPTNFTAAEALAVMVLCYEQGEGGRPLFCGPARSAAMKLEGSLPSTLRDHVREATGALTIRPAPSNPLEGREPIYEQLLRCVSRRQPVRIRYDSVLEEQQIQTKLSPYRLVFSRHSWYAIGRSSLHREVRTFNVGRILDVELLNERFQIPRGFSIERYLGNAWHLISERGADYEVVIRFRKLVARNVGEIVWHRTQRLERREDGSLDFRVTVSGLNEISWWVLSYGDQAVVLEPPELRQIVAARAMRLLENYRSSDLPGAEGSTYIADASDSRSRGSRSNGQS